MNVELGIGRFTMPLEVPDRNLLKLLDPNPVAHGLTGEEEVRRALADPIGSKRLCEIVSPGEKIVIVTSDITRPMPTYAVMPALLEELGRAGVKDEDLTVVFALGSHRHHTEEEMRYLVGDAVFDRIRCLDSDGSDVVHMGTTSRGTPVDIFRPVAEADRKICLGNIEYHYFAGYSGGAKAIMPGVSTWNAIQMNHRMMIQKEAHAGNIATNPIRLDIEEATALVGVDFILNVVLDEHKKIVKAVAGEVTLAHREGCAFLDQLYQVKIPHPADIVVVSQGGAPKDLNLYQTQKALDNAKHAVKDGGIIILVGSCIEGFGNPTFEKWLTEAGKPEDLVERIHQTFQLGGHKAAAIALVQERADIYLVSDMDPETVKSIFMEPFEDVQGAFHAAMRKMGPDAEVIIMPFGGSTLPVCEREGQADSGDVEIPQVSEVAV